MPARASKTHEAHVVAFPKKEHMGEFIRISRGLVPFGQAIALAHGEGRPLIITKLVISPESSTAFKKDLERACSEMGVGALTIKRSTRSEKRESFIVPPSHAGERLPKP